MKNYTPKVSAVLVCALLALTVAGAASAQTIVQSRGVDSRVDYASLLEYGPWDDRNYSLTKDDMRVFADNVEC